ATAAGAIYSRTINAKPLNARRQDNVTVLDIRVERPFAVSHLKVRGLVELFNLTNTDAADARTITANELSAADIDPAAADAARRRAGGVVKCSGQIWFFSLLSVSR